MPRGPFIVGQVVPFTATISKQVTSLAWNFGDGSFPVQTFPFSTTTAMQTHVFLTSNSNLVTVTAKTPSATATASFNVIVLAGFRGHLAGTSITSGIFALKHSFALNFKQSGRDKMDVILFSSNFIYPTDKASKAEFAREIASTNFNMLVGNSQFETLKLFQNGKGFGNKGGTVQWNPRNGQIHYSIKNAQLQTVLGSFGAVNAKAFLKQINLPITFQIGGVGFNNTAILFYSAKAGRSGQGR